MEEDNAETIEATESIEMVGGSGRGAISAIVALIPLSITWLIAYYTLNVWMAVLGFIIATLLYSSVRMNNQWEQAIILRLGKYVRTVDAGIFFVIPFVESAITRDLRVRTLDIRKQQVITKDNISVGVDAVVFLKVVDTKKSIVNIQNFIYAVKQYSQTTLRNVIGQKMLDELLEKRESIAKAVKGIVDEQADRWGVDVEGIELQDIELPEDMKRIMARQAEAEREKRGVIIASEGEVAAAKNLKIAADTLMKSKGKIGMRLRELATISDVSQDQSNTIVFYPTSLGMDSVVSGTALAQSRKKKQ
jgi:regulator of protease activity HflC (stomatin/prohibitin superfamily)